MTSIDRILAGDITCPGEIRHFTGTNMLVHLTMHADGHCTKGSRPTKGHWHPGADPVSDGTHARTLLREAAALCTCGDHRTATA